MHTRKLYITGMILLVVGAALFLMLIRRAEDAHSVVGMWRLRGSVNTLVFTEDGAGERDYDKFRWSASVDRLTIDSRNGTHSLRYKIGDNGSTLVLIIPGEVEVWDRVSTLPEVARGTN